MHIFFRVFIFAKCMHISHVLIFAHAVKKKILRVFNFEKSTKNCEICENMFTRKLVHLSYKKRTLKTN